jgi:chromosome partitioning protein
MLSRRFAGRDVDVQVVALVSTKGGAGKSTLAECLAVAAAQEGQSVYLLDLDPQQSTAAWWRRRKGPDNPLLVTGVETASRALALLRKKKAERDLMIIDTPGSFLGVIDDAINEAAAIIVVVQSSPKDLEAQGAVEGLIAKSGLKDRTLYALNRVDRTSLTKSAVETLRTKLAREPVLIGHRVEYVKADASGKVANETSEKAKAEIATLWDAVKGVMENG